MMKTLGMTTLGTWIGASGALVLAMSTARAIPLTGTEGPGASEGLGEGIGPGEVTPVRYDDHRIVRIDTPDADAFARAMAVTDEFMGCHPHPGLQEFRVSPDTWPTLIASGLDFEVVVEDVQARIEAEAERIRTSNAGDWFADYKDLDQISAYVDDLIDARPDLVTRWVTGTSLEGRPIHAFRISSAASEGCRPTVLFNSGQHAREWLAPMVNMFVADMLVREYDTDEEIRALVDGADWVFVPIMNPDGYVHSWSGDRLWRKNRRDNGDGTFGVDLNRNWGFMWGLDLPHSFGGSDQTRSQVYWGTGPFSEPETSVMRDLAQSLPTLRIHNDLHTQGLMILYPWGFTPDPSPDALVHDHIATRINDGIVANGGPRYDQGSIYDVLYPISGSCVDWMFGSLGIQSLSYELQGPGFDPPPGTIRINAEYIARPTLEHGAWAIETFTFVSDWNDDCVHDINDVIAYLADFDANLPAADLNDDDVLNIFDLIEFLQRFSEGR